MRGKLSGRRGKYEGNRENEGKTERKKRKGEGRMTGIGRI